MRKTEFLKLHLPDENEYYNVELDQNQNFIMVDGKLKEHDTALTTIQQGATNEQKGIVQFGTEEGKALEGMMLARLAGAYGFGGDIQNPGVKNQNYIYYDNNTRKMYKCLNQNSDTSANVQNYIPMDNFSILDRLENLCTFTHFENYFQDSKILASKAYLYKINMIKITYIHINCSTKGSIINIKFPENYITQPFVTVTDGDTGTALPSFEGISIDWATKESVSVKNTVSSFNLLVVGH